MAKSVRKIGDWDGLRYLSMNLQKDLMASSIVSVKRFGLIAEKIAKEHIANQDLGWAPLSEKYKERKADKGFSELILVRTATYFQSITSWQEKLSGYAGVKKGVKNEEGEEVADIARVHEYGTDIAGKNNNVTIPARPLWQPTFQEAFTKWKADSTPLHIYKSKHL